MSPISTQVLNGLTLRYSKVHLIDSRSVAVLMEVISLTRIKELGTAKRHDSFFATCVVSSCLLPEFAFYFH